MTPEEQRIAIARETDQLRWTYLDGTRYPDCPRYLDDLNAMHDVIMGLSLEEQCEITEILRRDILQFKAPTITASAAQLAEAFLRHRNFSIEPSA